MDVMKRSDFLPSDEEIVMKKTIYLQGFPVHSHEFLEIVYIARGSGTHHINEHQYEVTAGDVFFLNHSSKHTFRRISDDFLIINCVFLPGVLEDCLVQAGNAEYLLHSMLYQRSSDGDEDFLFSVNILGREQEFDYLFTDMNREYLNRDDGYELVLRSYLTIVVSKIFRLASTKQATARRDAVRQAIDYMHAHFHKPLRLDEIAEQAMLSPAYFSAVFREETGVTVTDFLHDIRLQEACRMLNDDAGNIRDIIAAVGYSDAKSFYKIFRRRTGMTPGEYRKRQSGSSIQRS